MFTMLIADMSMIVIVAIVSWRMTPGRGAARLHVSAFGVVGGDLC
jgi:hypothetical protein